MLDRITTSVISRNASSRSAATRSNHEGDSRRRRGAVRTAVRRAAAVRGATAVGVAGCALAVLRALILVARAGDRADPVADLVGEADGRLGLGSALRGPLGGAARGRSTRRGGSPSSSVGGDIACVLSSSRCEVESSCARSSLRSRSTFSSSARSRVTSGTTSGPRPSTRRPHGGRSASSRSVSRSSRRSWYSTGALLLGAELVRVLRPPQELLALGPEGVGLLRPRAKLVGLGRAGLKRLDLGAQPVGLLGPRRAARSRSGPEVVEVGGAGPELVALRPHSRQRLARLLRLRAGGVERGDDPLRLRAAGAGVLVVAGGRRDRLLRELGAGLGAARAREVDDDAAADLELGALQPRDVVALPAERRRPLLGRPGVCRAARAGRRRAAVDLDHERRSCAAGG